MTDTKFKLGEILKVSPKTKPERFWYEKVIETTPEIITEDMPEEEWADISKQGLCDNFNYEAVETFKISSALKALHQAKIISSNLPVMPSLPFDNTRLRQVVIGQNGYGMDGCNLCGSKWMRRPNMEKVEHKQTCLAYPQTKGNEA